MRHELQMVAFQPSQRHTYHLEKPRGYMGKPTSVSSWCFFLQNWWDVGERKTSWKSDSTAPKKNIFDKCDYTLSLYFKVFCNTTRLMSARLRFRSSGRHSPSHLVLLPLRKKPIKSKNPDVISSGGVPNDFVSSETNQSSWCARTIVRIRAGSWTFLNSSSHL